MDGSRILIFVTRRNNSNELIFSLNDQENVGKCEFLKYKKLLKISLSFYNNSHRYLIFLFIGWKSDGILVSVTRKNNIIELISSLDDQKNIIKHYEFLKYKKLLKNSLSLYNSYRYLIFLFIGWKSNIGIKKK